MLNYEYFDLRKLPAIRYIVCRCTRMQTNRFLVIHFDHLLLQARLGDEVNHLNGILKEVLYSMFYK